MVENWTATCKRTELDHFIHYTQNNSKWIKDLYGRPETIKFLGENTGSNLSEIGLSSILEDMSPWAKATKAKMNK